MSRTLNLLMVALCTLSLTPAAMADHSAPRCATESNGTWITLRDNRATAIDTARLANEVIQVCQSRPNSNPQQCAFHVACSTDPAPYTAYFCAARLRSRPNFVLAQEWATPNNVQAVQQLLMSACAAGAVDFRDRLFCENTVRNCAPINRMEIDEDVNPISFAQMRCVTSAFRVAAYSDIFVEGNGDLIYRQQAVDRCMHNFANDPFRRDRAAQECARNIVCSKVQQ